MPGRFETVEEGQPFTVVVDYSHKPGALENVLRAARDLARGRVLCVFGCGGDRDRTKRPLMGRIAADLADVAIVTSDNPRSEDPGAIIEEVVAGAPGRLEIEPDRRAAIERALEAAGEGDVVVIAGKGHEQGQEIGGARAAVRRPRGGERGAPLAGGDGVIPLPLAEVEPLGRLIRAGWTDEATGMQVDSRRVEEGDLFVAVGGGGDFAKHAFARGAAAVLDPADEFGALAAIGAAVRSRSSATVVGITGSTGKTSTKDILAALCAPHAKVVAAEGGHNNEIGLPLTLARIEPDTEIVIAEMGMRGLGQIAELCEIAKPKLGIVTSVGPVHLELLGTVERVAQAKAEIFGALPADGIAIAPAGRHGAGAVPARRRAVVRPRRRRVRRGLRGPRRARRTSATTSGERSSGCASTSPRDTRPTTRRRPCSRTRRSAFRSSGRRRAPIASPSRAGAGRKRRFPAKVSSSTTPTTPIPSRWRPLSGT